MQQNIFAGDDGTFMIGDFGLSKMILDANDHMTPDIDPHANAIILPGLYVNGGDHTVGVGTASYASPEQTTSKIYGPAADVFSLGLILLELFSNFTSEHERAKAFHDCRHGRELAPWMMRDHPEASALILACTEADWTRRPSASDIQAAGLFHEKRGNVVLENYWSELTTLRMETARKDRLIESQARQLKDKDDMIEDLKRRLARRSAFGEKSPDDLATFPDSGSDSSSDDDY
jgi:serine/threonine protein kinase